MAAGGGGMFAAAADRAGGSARAGLQWGLAALGTCVVFFVAGRLHVVPEPPLALGLAALLVGVGTLFPIVGYVTGDTRPMHVVAAIALSLAVAAAAVFAGLAPLWGRPDLSTPLVRAALPVLVLPAVFLSAAVPPGAREGWRLAHAVAALVAFGSFLALQNAAVHPLKHVVGAGIGAMLAGPVAVAVLRGLLRAMGVVRPVSRRELGAPTANPDPE